MFSKLKSDPITTVCGLLSGASLWLSQQAMLEGHPAGKQILQVAGAALVALLGWFAADIKPKA